MALFKRLLGGAPSTARDFYEEGLACEKKARHEPALANFDEAIRLDPEFADAFYARAFVHEIMGDVEQVVADSQRVIEQNPSVGDALVIESNDHD